MRQRVAIWISLAALLLAPLAATTVHAWGPQGHRLVAAIAASELTPAARLNVEWLLRSETLVEVAGWADQQESDRRETSAWHYVNIPLDARAYDRARDCPRPRGPAPRDEWRDCVVDRILQSESRLADARLPRSERTEALKFLVHLVADVHQPFHAVGVERGGNNIQISVLGSPLCGRADRRRYDCNLHSLWDTTLIAVRGASDKRYLATLDALVRRLRGRAGRGTPSDWAMESHAAAKAALLPRDGDANEAYVRTNLPVAEERLVLAGLRLARILNRTLQTPPPGKGAAR